MSENKTPEQKSEPETTSTFEINEDGPAKYRELMKKRQSIPMGILGGIAASIIGNAIWIGVLLLGYKIDFLALCIGFFIGYSVKFLGKGLEPKFGYIAGAIALLSTLSAYFTIGCILFSKVNHIAFLSVFSHLDFTTALYLIRGAMGKGTTEFFNVIFTISSIGIAYYFSFKPLKEF